TSSPSLLDSLLFFSTATTDPTIPPLSLHDALPIYTAAADARPFDLRARLLAMPRYRKRMLQVSVDIPLIWLSLWLAFALRLDDRSEEHTSELQSRENIVCRLLLEKKKHTSELQSPY